MLMVATSVGTACAGRRYFSTSHITTRASWNHYENC